MCTVMIADDHRLLRQGIRQMLEAEPDIEVVAEAADGKSAVQEVKLLHPDILIADIGLPDMNGIEVARQVCRECIGTSVVILSMHDEDEYVCQALIAGVKGYVVKSSGIEHLLRAIRQADGQCYLSPPLQSDPAYYIYSGGESENRASNSL